MDAIATKLSPTIPFRVAGEGPKAHTYEGMTLNVPEKEVFDAIRPAQGLKAFLEARDRPFR